jgi:hypothetical protein
VQLAAGVAVQVSGPAGTGGTPEAWQVLQEIPACLPEVIWKQASWAFQVPGVKRQVEWQPRQSVLKLPVWGTAAVAVPS